MSKLECGTCKFAFMEKERRNEVQIECRRHPPIYFKTAALPNFQKYFPVCPVAAYGQAAQNTWILEGAKNQISTP